jgi:hypothetical protein
MTPNTPEPPKTHREFASVRIGADGLAEMDRSRRILFVPRNEVHGLELVYASAAERPILTALMGVILLLLALFPFAFLFLVLTRGGSFHTAIFWLTGFAVPGVWLLWFAFKSRHVLLVHTAKGGRKLAFQRSASHEDIVRFITEAAPRFGYPFSLQDVGYPKQGSRA